MEANAKHLQHDPTGTDAPMIRLAIGLFLILLPFLELVVIIKTSNAIGFMYTLLLMLAAGVGGGLVISQQSSSAFRQALEASGRGEIPHGPVLDGLFLMFAGILLVFPGLITDAMGLLLLIPPVRRLVARKAFAGIICGSGPLDERFDPDRQDQGRRASPFDRPAGPQSPGSGPVIEGEFERLDEQPRKPGTRGGNSPGER